MHHYGFALPALWDTGTTFKTCGWQTLLHNPRQGDASTGLSHQSNCVASVEAASAWREWGSFSPILWMCVPQRAEESIGSDISTNPPLLWLSRPPLLSAPLPDNWNLSWGAERTAGVSCYHANSPCYPLKTRGSQLRGMRERERPKKPQHFGSLLCYHTRLIVGWHGNEQPS